MKFTFQLAAAILAPLLITSPIRAEIQAADHPPASQLHISIVDRESATAVAGSESSSGFTLQVTDQSGAPVGESAVVFRLPDEGASGSFSDASHSAIVYTAADGRAHIPGIKWNETAGQVAIKVTATKGDARAGFLLTETLAEKTLPMAASKASVSTALPGSMPVSAASIPLEQPGTPKEKSSAARISEAPQPSAPPAVSVVNNSKGEAGHHSGHKKWIILAVVVAAAAGAGLAVGGKKSSAAASSSTSGVSVGAPSVSVGKP